jgi:hypothetical protein
MQQGNSDMGAPGTRRCGDDYAQGVVPVDSSRRITECLRWQWQRDHAAAGASTLQELGFWMRGSEPFKVRQVRKEELLLKKKHSGVVIKRRYPSLVLTAFLSSRPDLSLRSHVSLVVSSACLSLYNGVRAASCTVDMDKPHRRVQYFRASH